MARVDEAVLQRPADVVSRQSGYRSDRVPGELTHLHCALVLPSPPIILCPKLGSRTAYTPSYSKIISILPPAEYRRYRQESVYIITQYNNQPLYLVTTTPALDDGDDVVDLDVQLVGLVEVLQRPHVGRHGLHQELSESHERRPVVGFLRPALQHDIIDVLGTVLGLRQPLALLVDLMEDLCRTHYTDAG